MVSRDFQLLDEAYTRLDEDAQGIGNASFPAVIQSVEGRDTGNITLTVRGDFGDQSNRVISDVIPKQFPAPPTFGQTVVVWYSEGGQAFADAVGSTTETDQKNTPVLTGIISDVYESLVGTEMKVTRFDFVANDSTGSYSGFVPANFGDQEIRKGAYVTVAKDVNPNQRNPDIITPQYRLTSISYNRDAYSRIPAAYSVSEQQVNLGGVNRGQLALKGIYFPDATYAGNVELHIPLIWNADVNAYILYGTIPNNPIRGVHDTRGEDFKIWITKEVKAHEIDLEGGFGCRLDETKYVLNPRFEDQTQPYPHTDRNRYIGTETDDEVLGYEQERWIVKLCRSITVLRITVQYPLTQQLSEYKVYIIMEPVGYDFPPSSE